MSLLNVESELNALLEMWSNYAKYMGPDTYLVLDSILIIYNFIKAGNALHKIARGVGIIIIFSVLELLQN